MASSVLARGMRGAIIGAVAVGAGLLAYLVILSPSG